MIKPGEIIRTHSSIQRALAGINEGSDKRAAWL